MRCLFVSAQLPGHLDWGGFLATAVRLQQRGHAVLWASGAPVESAVAQRGLPFHAVTETGWRWPPPPPLTPAPDTPHADVVRAMQMRALDQWLDVARVGRAVAALAPVLTDFRPHVVVAEMFMAAAAVASARAGIPFVVAGWPAPRPDADVHAQPLAHESRTRLETLLHAVGAPADNWTATGPAALCSPHLHISYWSPAWHGVAPAAATGDPHSAGMHHGSQTRYVGGARAAETVAPPAEFPAPGDAPWVLITLGTSFNRDLAFFANAAQAAAALGCLPLIATGRKLDATEKTWLAPRLPRAVVVRTHIDFAACLPYVRAAVHHGGAGTTHALVLHGVPQIVTPHAADQHRQAQGVARTEVGFHIAPRQADIENLTRALATLLPDLSPYRTRAQALQAEFAALGGVDRAATLVEAVAGSR